ncbi:MAG: hypothetical protein AB7H43_02050 [Acidimicrobiia bacterium]
MGELLRTAVVLLAAGEPLRGRGRVGRAWFVPVAVAIALLAADACDWLDVTQPSARIAAGLVLVTVTLWQLTLGAAASSPVAAVVAAAAGSSLDTGRGTTVWAALLAGAALLVLAGRPGRAPSAQLAGVVLAVAGVGLVLAGIDAV